MNIWDEVRKAFSKLTASEPPEPKELPVLCLDGIADAVWGGDDEPDVVQFYS